MPNIFSSPWFLDAAARVFYPGGGVRPGVVELEGLRYDVLLRRDGHPAPIPLSDYLEPRPADRGEPTRRVPYLPRVARELVPTPDGQLDACGLIPAPRIDWRGFDRFEDFAGQSARRSRNAFKRHRRKLARLGREVGPTRFTHSEPDHAVLEIALRWKSEQLRHMRRPDRFASRRNRQLVHLLLEEGHLQQATLFTDGRPAAVVIGHDHGTHYTAWITAYDHGLANYSPGILAFESLMEHCWGRGHTHFDFLSGGETYKLNYATHAWLVGPVGRAPLRSRLARRARAWIRDPNEHQGPRAAAFEASCRFLDWRQARQGLAPVGSGAPWTALIERNQANWPGCGHPPRG